MESPEGSAHASSDPLLPDTRPNSKNDAQNIAKPSRHTLLSIGLLYFLLNFVWYVLEVPSVRLFEYATCQQYYRSRPEGVGLLGNEVDEKLCKIQPIQNKVAMLVGIKISLDYSSTFLTALFYSFVADKCGRRLVVVLGLIGELLATIWFVTICRFNRIFPTQLAWLSAVMLCIGGGQPVVSSILLTMLTEIIQPSRKIHFLYILHLLSLLSGVLGAPLAAMLLARGLQFPFILSIFLYALLLAIAAAVTETRVVAAKPWGSNSSADPTGDNQQEAPSELSVLTWKRIRHSEEFKATREKFYNVLLNPQIFLCLFIFALKRAGFQSQPFLYQYASERFGLRLQQTPWLRSILSATSVVAVGIVLPALTSYLRKNGFRESKIDLGVLRGSVIVLALTFLGIFAASKPAVFTLAVGLCGLGEGLEPALQAHSSALIEKTQTSQLYTAIATIETFARVIAASIMAKLYSLNRERNEKPSGLPFLVSTIVFAIGMVSSFSLVPPKTR